VVVGGGGGCGFVVWDCVCRVLDGAGFLRCVGRFCGRFEGGGVVSGGGGLRYVWGGV